MKRHDAFLIDEQWRQALKSPFVAEAEPEAMGRVEHRVKVRRWRRRAIHTGGAAVACSLALLFAFQVSTMSGPKAVVDANGEAPLPRPTVPHTTTTSSVPVAPPAPDAVAPPVGGADDSPDGSSSRPTNPGRGDAPGSAPGDSAEPPSAPTLAPPAAPAPPAPAPAPAPAPDLVVTWSDQGLRAEPAALTAGVRSVAFVDARSGVRDAEFQVELPNGSATAVGQGTSPVDLRMLGQYQIRSSSSAGTGPTVTIAVDAPRRAPATEPAGELAVDVYMDRFVYPHRDAGAPGEIMLPDGTTGSWVELDAGTVKVTGYSHRLRGEGCNVRVLEKPGKWISLAGEGDTNWRTYDFDPGRYVLVCRSDGDELPGMTSILVVR